MQDSINYGNVATQNAVDQAALCAFEREVELQIGGVNANVIQNRYENSLAELRTQAQIASCCCEELRATDQVRFEAAQNTCAIMQNADCNAQKIIDKMTCLEIGELRDKLQEAKFQNSQYAQNAYLVDKIKPCPIPAYPACNPYASAPFAPFGGYGGYGFNNFGGHDHCGCNCGCGCN